MVESGLSWYPLFFPVTQQDVVLSSCEHQTEDRPGPVSPSPPSALPPSTPGLAAPLPARGRTDVPPSDILYMPLLSPIARRRGCEGMRATHTMQCEPGSWGEGGRGRGQTDGRRRERKEGGIILWHYCSHSQRRSAEEERRTPLHSLAHSLHPAAAPAVSRKHDLDEPTRILSSVLGRRGAAQRRDATPTFEQPAGDPSNSYFSSTPQPSVLSNEERLQLVCRSRRRAARHRVCRPRLIRTVIHS